jgi:hypothetical protein
MPDYQPIDYRLRCHTKRTDLPADVLRDIGEAYAEIERLRKERDYARREACRLIEKNGGRPAKDYADSREWDCFNTPKAKVDKTLNGVIVDGGKPIPPKYEDLDDE